MRATTRSPRRLDLSFPLDHGAQEEMVKLEEALPDAQAAPMQVSDVRLNS